MIIVGQKVFYKESNKIYNHETKFLGVVRKVRNSNKLVVLDPIGNVLGTIREGGISGKVLTTFAGIRLEVVTKL